MSFLSRRLVPFSCRLCGWLLGWLVAACQPAPAPPATGAARPASAPVSLPLADHLPAPANATQARFFALLHQGDSVYALKRGDESLAQSLGLYTRAQALATAAADTLLLAEAVFARGRVYDAWNKEPQTTVALFQQATNLFRRVPGQQARTYYAWHLLAHAYDKVPDTLRATAELRAIRRALAGRSPALLRQLPFTVEMALIATEVGAYPLADSLLRQLVRRAWVRNDPETYDHLTHYYLVRSRLDVLYRHRPASPYPDSLGRAYRATRPAPDRLFYAEHLARLAAAAGRYPLAYNYQRDYQHLSDSLHGAADVARLRQALLRSEEAAARQQAAAEAARQAARTRLLWLLSSGLLVISLLSFYLARQNRLARRQARRLVVVNQELGSSNHALAAANQELAHVNGQLDEQVAQVELLNKEIQHRVKNNLHILFSLLRMQERRTDNPEVLEQLRAARLRVESIAALHQQLMRQTGELPLAEFLRTLVNTAVACLTTDQQVLTHLHTEAVALPPAAYFPLALILNEWITNSVKYAAPAPGEALALTISVAQAGPDGHPCLRYADNGRQSAARQPGAAGLGSQIIQLLVRQLRATLHTPAPYQYELCLSAPDDLAE